MKIRNLIFLLWISAFTFLTATQVDISNRKVPNWELELQEEIFMEDVFAPPFDYDYIGENLYLVLNKVPAVAVYDLEGNMLHYIDHKGEGPGELSRPVYIWDTPDSEGITIYDEGHYRYHLFDYQLKYRESRDVTPQQFINKIYTFDNHKYQHISSMEFLDGSIKFKHALQYLKGEKIYDIYSNDCHMFLKGWFRYNQPVSRILSGNRLVTAIQSRSEYNVMYIKNKEVEKSVSKKIKPVKFSNEEIEENRTFTGEMEERFKNMYKTPENLIANQMVISDIVVTKDDNVWVLTRDNTGQFFDILSENGELIATARNDDNKKLARTHISGNYLYTVIDDEDENYYMRRYKIVK